MIFSFKLQERRGFVFCQEDRAILCRECDIPIHKANEHTEKHNRFLLSGIKLSASSSSYDTSSSSNGSNLSTETDMKSLVSKSNSGEKTLHIHYSSTPTTTPNWEVDDHHSISLGQEDGSVSTSSISEYLMETLPGWHVDDFLDPSSSSPYGFCKVCITFLFRFFQIKTYIFEALFLRSWPVKCILCTNFLFTIYMSSLVLLKTALSSQIPNEIMLIYIYIYCGLYFGIWLQGYNHSLPFDDLELNIGSLSSEHLSIWVPEPTFQSHHYHHQLQQTGALNGQILEGSEEVDSTMKGSNTRKWSREDCFKVPHFINPPSIKKRSRQ